MFPLRHALFCDPICEPSCEGACMPWASLVFRTNGDSLNDVVGCALHALRLALAIYGLRLFRFSPSFSYVCSFRSVAGCLRFRALPKSKKNLALRHRYAGHGMSMNSLEELCRWSVLPLPIQPHGIVICCSRECFLSAGTTSSISQPCNACCSSCSASMRMVCTAYSRSAGSN